MIRLAEIKPEYKIEDLKIPVLNYHNEVIQIPWLTLMEKLTALPNERTESDCKILGMRIAKTLMESGNFYE